MQENEKALRTPEEILGKNTGMTFDEDTHLIQTHFEYVIKSMEEYASQFKYDYSQSCKCNHSIGSTWCCNQCGLPITKKP